MMKRIENRSHEQERGTILFVDGGGQHCYLRTVRLLSSDILAFTASRSEDIISDQFDLNDLDRYVSFRFSFENGLISRLGPVAFLVCASLRLCFRGQVS